MATLLSARPPSSHGAGVERDAGGKLLRETGWRDFRSLSGDVLTLGEAFRARGYATAGIVTNPFLRKKFGLHQGFDPWVYLGRGRAGEVVDQALRWFDERPEGPAFTLLHFFDPHLPYDPPGGFAGRFTAADAGGGELPVSRPGPVRSRVAEMSALERRFVAHAYDEEIAYLDDELGRLFETLGERGELDDTLVVFTSDHGEELFEHGNFEHGHTMYEEVLRVPLFVWGPGIEPGRSANPVSLVEASRALFRIAEGVAPGQAFEELSRHSGPFPVEGTLYGPDHRAWIDWPAKFTEIDGLPSMLFDLEADPREYDSLEDPEARERLRSALAERLREEATRAPGTQAADPDEETIEALRELGYVGDD